MVDVSCIIVTHENETTISDCLNSLLADAKGISCEILLVDNASRDKTCAVVHEIAKNNADSIRCIENVFNVGFARGTNQGLTAATGKYVLFLNPDTVIHPGFFQKMISFLDKNPGIGIVAPRQITSSGSVVPSCREFPTHLSILYYVLGFSFIFPKSRLFNSWKMGYFDHALPRPVDQPMGACLISRKSDIDRAGFMDERFRMFFNDVDWCKRFALMGKPAYFLPNAVITHDTGHSVRMYPRRMIVSSHRAFSKYLRKYYRGARWVVPNALSSLILLLTAFLRILVYIPKNARSSHSR